VAEAEPEGRARQRFPPQAEGEAEPWGRARRSFLLRPRLTFDRCRFRPGGWHSSRSRAGDAVFLSDRSVKGRSDCGHFDLAD
jgi:hypothetical protein